MDTSSVSTQYTSSNSFCTKDTSPGASGCFCPFLGNGWAVVVPSQYGVRKERIDDFPQLILSQPLAGPHCPSCGHPAPTHTPAGSAGGYWGLSLGCFFWVWSWNPCFSLASIISPGLIFWERGRCVFIILTITRN